MARPAGHATPPPPQPPTLSCCRTPLTADKAPGNAAGRGQSAATCTDIRIYPLPGRRAERRPAEKEGRAHGVTRARTLLRKRGTFSGGCVVNGKRFVANLASRRFLLEQRTARRDIGKYPVFSTNAQLLICVWVLCASHFSRRESPQMWRQRRLAARVGAVETYGPCHLSRLPVKE